ncbi:MAG: flagellar biosynthesis protein FliQ [Clostridiales bacterium]|nr:flagellar biosynthesis protein FliQ [Clostridiales bacterium]
MTQETILDIVREGLFTIIWVAAPPLLMGLAAGLIISIFQTITSIQEQTLAFIPKILAVLLSLILFGPFMIDRLQAYIEYLITNLPNFITPR